MGALHSHLYGQGPGKRATHTGNVKSACPNFFTKFAYFLTYEICDNKIYCRNRDEVCGVQYQDGIVPEDVLDEMAYRTFHARMVVDQCNEDDNSRMCYDVRPPPNVPAEFILRFVVQHPRMSLSHLGRKHGWYLENWRNMYRGNNNADKNEVLLKLKERMEFETRVERYAKGNNITLPDVFKPVKAEDLLAAGIVLPSTNQDANLANPSLLPPTQEDNLVANPSGDKEAQEETDLSDSVLPETSECASPERATSSPPRISQKTGTNKKRGKDPVKEPAARTGKRLRKGKKPYSPPN
jgi:hypothetical protein